MHVTREQLADLCPRPAGRKDAATWEGYVEAIEQAGGLFEHFGITTPLRFAHLIATWAHETGGFVVDREDMSYRPERIVEVFGAHRHSAGVTLAEARKLAGNAYALAERVYGLGNPKKAAELGNMQPGDGYAFRGCGIQQLTGRGDHEKYAAKIGCPLEALAHPKNSIAGALLEWAAKSCNAMADRDDVVAVRKAINGGRNGLEDVRRYLAEAKQIWHAIPPPIGQAPHVMGLGSKSDNVRLVQEKLTAAGFGVGKIDGRFGTLTTRGVAAFQVAHGLPGTGLVDAATYEAIVNAQPVEAVPGRESVTTAQLVSTGSVVAKGFQFSGRIGHFFTYVAGLLGLDQVTGFGAVEFVLDQGERIKQTSVRAQGLLADVLSAKMVIAVLCAGVGVALIVKAMAGQQARLDGAKKGAT